MRVTHLPAVVLTALAMVVSGCGADSGSKATSVPPEVSVPTSTVSTKVGVVERPSAWKPLPNAAGGQHTTSFSISEGGQVVGQMDVIVSSAPAGSPADVVNEAFTAERLPHFQDLRSRRRDFRDVVGAKSAFLEEHTYTTAQGEPARSVDQLAVASDGGVLLVRISSARRAFDRALFYQVLQTMELTKGQDG